MKRTMTRALGCGVLAAMAALAASTALAKSVTVKGEFAIEGGDEAAARKAALKDAFRKAVEQVAGIKVQSTTVASEWAIVKDEIIARTEGMVTSHKVISEGAKDGVYEITIQADVAEKPVGEAIEQLIGLKKSSKIAFLVAEKMAGKTDFSVSTAERGMTENLLINLFQERGFPVVDLSGLAGLDLSAGTRKGEISAADAEKIAQKANAQYVIMGKVEGRDAGPVMGTDFHSYQMNLTMQMFATSNHAVVATATEGGAVQSLSPVFNAAGLQLYKTRVIEKVANKLIERIAKRWTEEEQTGAKRVQLIVENVPNFKAVDSIVKALKKLKGVSEATRQSLVKKVATIDVDVESSTDTLAAQLSSTKLGGYKIEVTEVVEGRIVVTVGK
ncbi:MAG: flagellar assembly protein T N-terminal domain-containing protein [Deltaproteobacteria bacterium]|nr:flagellar assembly protein T N-terminal domain-containing protein [Deltaproteobacteria bacterium]